MPKSSCLSLLFIVTVVAVAVVVAVVIVVAVDVGAKQRVPLSTVVDGRLLPMLLSLSWSS